MRQPILCGRLILVERIRAHDRAGVYRGEKIGAFAAASGAFRPENIGYIARALGLSIIEKVLHLDQLPW
jgi:hypothetical protein